MGTYNNKIGDQALTWVARLRSDSVGEADLADFADWLGFSDKHQQAWNEALDAWETLGVIANMPLDQLFADDAQGDKKHSFLGNLFSGIWKPLTAFTATAVIALGLIMVVKEDRQYYDSGVGQYQQITLQDGSVIELNTDTAVAILIDENSRDIELLRGEAFFTVASDKTKPFIVSVGNAKVKALGTAFNIYRQTEQQSVVSVVEGVVRVSEISGTSISAPQSKVLLANDRVLVGESTGLSEPEASSLEQVTAWRNGQVLFDKASVAEAIVILNRYLERKIVVAGRVSSTHRISGVFSIREQSETLNAVAQAFDLALVSEGNNWRLSQPNP